MDIIARPEGVITAPQSSPPLACRRGAQAKAGRSHARRASRTPIMTAYRQQALASAAKVHLGLQRPRDLKPKIPDAPKLFCIAMSMAGVFEFGEDRGTCWARTVL